MATNKMTNVKALAFVLEGDYEFPTEVREKLEKIKASYEAKTGAIRKPTKAQEVAATIREDIVGVLEAEPERQFTATEVLDTIKDRYADLTLPKVTAALTKLQKDGDIERFTEKKKAFFRAKAEA